MTPPAPVYPSEFFLAKLIDSSVETPAPTSRVEKLLSMIGGDDDQYVDPVSRTDQFLLEWIQSLDQKKNLPIVNIARVGYAVI